MIAIDSTVIIDLLADSGPAADAAEACLRQSLSVGPVVVCDVALTEICTALKNGAEVLEALEDMGVGYSVTEAKSAVRAGEMQRRYRQRGGPAGSTAERTAAEFLVGAHALLQCDGLITRDHAFFRDYFKGLKVIVPKVS